MAALPTQFCWAGNRGALTTTFTPPSTCLETTSVYLAGYLAPPSAQSTFYYVGLWTQALPDYLPNYVSDSCMPPAATPIDLGQAWYYSPGICPSAYSPAAPLLTLPNICNSKAALPESVTAWLCCPSRYSLATAITDNDWLATTLCVSTAPGIATLTSVWPVSWVSAAGDFQSSSFWPISPPSGIVESAIVITKPTVIAEGIPIMWESTDTQVQSWFDQYQSSRSLPTTGSIPTQSVATSIPNLTTSPPPTQSVATSIPSLTTSPPPTQSVATPIPTNLTTSPPPTPSVATPISNNTRTSRASDRGRGNNLSVAALGALSLIAILILSS